MGRACAKTRKGGRLLGPEAAAAPDGHREITLTFEEERVAAYPAEVFPAFRRIAIAEAGGVLRAGRWRRNEVTPAQHVSRRRHHHQLPHRDGVTARSTAARAALTAWRAVPNAASP